MSLKRGNEKSGPIVRTRLQNSDFLRVGGGLSARGLLDDEACPILRRHPRPCAEDLSTYQHEERLGQKVNSNTASSGTPALLVQKGG